MNAAQIGSTRHQPKLLAGIAYRFARVWRLGAR